MQNCEDCGRLRGWINTGRRDERGAVIRQCGNCGRYQSEPPPQGLQLNKRALVYDIETSKMTVKTFSTSVPSKRLHWSSIKEPSFLICWSAAWITKDTKLEKIRVLSDAVTPEEAIARNDKRCLQGLWDLLNKADYWIGHNIKSFDTKVVNTRFIMNKMQAPDLSIKQLDTFSMVKKYFRNDSNALEYWRLRMGGNPKDDVRSEDWDGCEAGDQKSLNKMRKYNKGDVRESTGLLIDLRDYLISGGVDIFK